MELPAGWYPDPTDPARERFWTGDDWTQQVRPKDNWPAPPTQPTGAVTQPSLRDLLPQQPANNPAFPQTPPAQVTNGSRRARRSPRRVRVAIITLVALCVAAIPGAYYAMRYDQYKRQTEIDTMLELIEQSEAVMYTWMNKLEGYAGTIEAECSGSEERCAALIADPAFIADIENDAREAQTSLEAVADQFTKSNGLSILAWHGDVIRARDSYLDHNAAWGRHLDAIDGNIEEAFIDGASNDDIGPTFAITCRHLKRLKASDMFPLMTEGNQRRVEKICAD